MVNRGGEKSGVGGDKGDVGKQCWAISLARFLPGGALCASEGIAALPVGKGYLGYSRIQAQRHLCGFINSPAYLARNKLGSLPPSGRVPAIARQHRPGNAGPLHAEALAHLGGPGGKRTGLGIDHVAHLDAVIPHRTQLIALRAAGTSGTGFRVEGA